MEAEHRWSLGKSADIVFRLEGQTAVRGKLTMNVGTLGTQRLAIDLNEQRVFEAKLNTWDHTLAIEFEPAVVSVGELNTIRFSLPDAARPGRDDPRVLGLAIRWVEAHIDSANGY